MPAKHIPTAEQQDTLKRELVMMGYRPMTFQEVKKDEERLDYMSPRNKEGTKIPYTLKENYYDLRIYPSLLFETKTFAESSAAWGVIRDKDKRVFFTPRLHRTGNFVFNFLGWAEILKTLVSYRPLCPDTECRDLMYIEEKNAIHRGYRWVCNKRKDHYLPESCIVELMTQKMFKTMSPRAQKVWKTYLSHKKSYTEKLNKINKKPGKARELRLPGKIGRPQNIH